MGPFTCGGLVGPLNPGGADCWVDGDCGAVVVVEEGAGSEMARGADGEFVFIVSSVGASGMA